MNKILLALLTIGFAFSTQAQTIILEQDFQGFANGGDIPFFDVADDAEAEDWISVDADNLEDGSGASPARPGNWYGSTDLRYNAVEEIVGDTNFVMVSSSWMSGFAPGNRNWLITPEVEVEDGYILNWSSGVFQTPRYADGYSVRISPEAEVEDLEANFSDVLWTQAQMVEDVSWNADFYPGIDYAGCSPAGQFDIESFCWFPETYGDGTNGTGYRHAGNHSIEEYLTQDTLDGAATSWLGLLEPHSLDLSAYAGMTVRIAWVHNSDDDNLMMVDDISVEAVTSVAELEFDQLVSFYPNPASDVLNLNFSTFVKQNAIVNVYDAAGRIVLAETFSGNNLNAFHTLDITALETGIYSMQVTIDNETVVGRNFMKK